MYDFFVYDYLNNVINSVNILCIWFLNYLVILYYSKKYLISIYIIKLKIFYNSLMRILGYKFIWCYV